MKKNTPCHNSTFPNTPLPAPPYPHATRSNIPAHSLAPLRLQQRLILHHQFKQRRHRQRRAQHRHRLNQQPTYISRDASATVSGSRRGSSRGVGGRNGVGRVDVVFPRNVGWFGDDGCYPLVSPSWRWYWYWHKHLHRPFKFLFLRPACVEFESRFPPPFPFSFCFFCSW